MHRAHPYMHRTELPFGPDDCAENYAVHRPYRKPWTAEEDEAVRTAVLNHGLRQWPMVAALCPGRTGKQCRERWHNHLDTAVKKEPWSINEERKIIELQAKFGNRWSDIAKYMPGRTDNAIKNHFNSVLRRGESIDHLRLADGTVPSTFPGGVVPEVPPAWQVTASTIPAAAASGTVVAPLRHPMRPTPQEADKINSLLKVEPTSSLAVAVGYPVSSNRHDLSTSVAQPALTALLAVIRARDKHELLTATKALEGGVRTVLSAQAVDAIDPNKPRSLLRASSDSTQRSSGSSSSSCTDDEEADAIALADAVVSMSTEQQIKELSRDLGVDAARLTLLLPSNPPSAREELERCASVSPLRPGKRPLAAAAAVVQEGRVLPPLPPPLAPPTPREVEPLPALMPSLLPSLVSPSSLALRANSPRCASGEGSCFGAGSNCYSPAAC